MQRPITKAKPVNEIKITGSLVNSCNKFIIKPSLLSDSCSVEITADKKPDVDQC
jgi:hypothetical protein